MDEIIIERPDGASEELTGRYLIALARERHFGRVREILMSDDAVYNLAALIEGHETLNRLSKQNISSFLPITEQTRSGILSTAQSYLKVVNSDSALRSLSKSTINLDAVRRGDPMTIYIVIPPDKLESHGALLRLWVGALMLTVMGRKRRPKRAVSKAITGAMINFNANSTAAANAFNGGHNLHKLRLSQAAVYTIPIFPPSC